MIGAPEAHEMDKAMIFATNAKKVLDIGQFSFQSRIRLFILFRNFHWSIGPLLGTGPSRGRKGCIDGHQS